MFTPLRVTSRNDPLRIRRKISSVASPLRVSVLVTVYLNVADAVLPCASVTVIVIFVNPNCPPAGDSANVRSAPLPPSVMFALGRSVVLDDVAVTVSTLAAVSASQMPNHVAGTAVLMLPATLAIEVMLGP